MQESKSDTLNTFEAARARADAVLSPIPLEKREVNWAAAGFTLLRVDHFVIVNASLDIIQKAIPDSFKDFRIKLLPGSRFLKATPCKQTRTMDVIMWECTAFNYITWTYGAVIYSCRLEYPEYVKPDNLIDKAP